MDPKHVAFLVKYIPFFSILAFLTPLLRYVRNVPYPEIDTLFTCFFGHAWYPLVNGSGPPGVLLPIPGDPLQARYSGPYVVDKKASEVNYVIQTPDRRKKKRLCHINMLKEYKSVDDEDEQGKQPVACVVVNACDADSDQSEEKVCDLPGIKLKNSEALSKLSDKLGHLPENQKSELSELIHEYKHLFPDVPGRTNVVMHDVDVGDSAPIKQHPYRANPVKMKHLRKEVEYMLENDIIEPSKSNWSSPSILVPKPDQTFRFCTDYRKLNSCTKSDSYPIPRIDDCIDRVGSAKYVSKFDLLKGYWQVPLTERAKELSAFVTPDGLFQYKVMPFGMKNAPATFQRLINDVTSGLDGCEAYVDDVVVCSDTWDSHVKRIRALFDRLTEAKLTVNLTKCEFAQAEVTFLGHVVGLGNVKPVHAKVEAILNFPVPENRRDLRRFLGMAGYYRKFCKNFADIAFPLTELLRKNVHYKWSPECQVAFERLKMILSDSPVLVAPRFDEPFVLAVDASGTGMGGVLMQSDSSGVERPVSYMSKKFNPHQRNYSTVEKETLALILALEHFDVYLGHNPVKVLTDHNPLVFLNKMKNSNQRLLRWSMALQERDLDIQHVKGKDNVVPDALSRV